MIKDVCNEFTYKRYKMNKINIKNNSIDNCFYRVECVSGAKKATRVKTVPLLFGWNGHLHFSQKK